MIKALLWTGAIAAALILFYSLIPSLLFRYFAKAPFPADKAHKRITLSFDDGPDARYTGRLLDILNENGVKAAFFLVAEKAARNPELVRRMLRDGHKVGFHSLSHRDVWREGPALQKKEFKAGMDILRGLGCEPEFYRAPWGHLNLTALLLARGYHLKIILWTVMAQDWEKSSSAGRVISRVTGRARNAGVICLHDSGCGKAAAGAPAETVEAVGRFIPMMKKAGFEFVLPEAR